MANQRVTTWSSVGYDVNNAKNLEQVLATSGLDYEVEKRRIYIDSENDGHATLDIPNRYVTCRPDGNGLKTYDVISDKFEIVQNRDAFDFVNYMDEDIKFVKAGETVSGMVFIIAALPECNILGDTFIPYIIFRNGFNGRTKITAAICPLRIVCQNQFNFAFQNTNNSIVIRHTRNAEARLIEARDTLKMTAEYMHTLTVQAEMLARNKVSVEKVVNILFPLPTGEELANMNPYARKNMEDARTAFINAHNVEDNYNFRNTAWGIVNAYSDYMTHRGITAGGDLVQKTENRFMTSIFSPSFGMNKVFDAIKKAS